MNLNISSINFKTFDNKNNKKYNSMRFLFDKNLMDTINFSGRCRNMDTIKEIKTISGNEAMQNSLVAFVPDLLLEYFEGSLPKNDFSELFKIKLNKVKYLFSQMPKELAIKNLTAFKNEITLAEQINSACIKAKNLNEVDFNKELEDYIVSYNKNYQDGFCGI